EDLDRLMHVLSATARATAAARQDAFRCGAANAGRGQGADGAAADAVQERALDGPGADPGGAAVRGHTTHTGARDTVFVVEQNAARALALADRGYVLQSGRVVLSATPVPFKKVDRPL